MRRAIYTLLCSALLLIAATLTAQAAKRVALVIGNDDYAQVPKLQKAVNDAKAIGAALEGIGFTVLRAENLTRREMNRQLQSFASRLEAGDEAVFFFAGHGGENAALDFLVPVTPAVVGTLRIIGAGILIVVTVWSLLDYLHASLPGMRKMAAN